MVVPVTPSCGDDVIVSCLEVSRKLKFFKQGLEPCLGAREVLVCGSRIP